MPTIRAALERAGLPIRLFALSMQVITEKRRFDIFAELARRFVSRKRNQPDAVRLWRLPLAVEPRTGNHEIRVLGIVLFRVPENLPRPPRIFLIPESRNVQIRDGCAVQLPRPRFFVSAVGVVRIVDA